MILIICNHVSEGTKMILLKAWSLFVLRVNLNMFVFTSEFMQTNVIVYSCYLNSFWFFSCELRYFFKILMVLQKQVEHEKK